MAKAIIYCRVSSVEQVDGTSLESQERMCREYADRQGIEVIEVLLTVENQ
jgi:site-specific DNA recombinase